MTSSNAISEKYLRRFNVGITELVLIAIPLFAAFVVVSEDNRVNKEK